MSRPSDYERLILHAVRLWPALLRTEGLSVDIFTGDTNRRLFCDISDLFEERGGDDPVDIVLLAERTEISVEDINRLEDGCQNPVKGSMEAWIGAQMLEKTTREYVRLTSSDAEIYAKTRTVDPAHFARIRELITILEGGPNGRVRFARRKCSEIEDEPIRWIARGIIPLRMTAAITGPPGSGKTLVAADASARVSRGLAFPVYSEAPVSPPVLGNVLYLSSEGVPSSILRPRLHAAGADLNRIDIIEGTLTKTKELAIFDVTRHLPDLRREVEKDPEIRLVVIDPIASFMPTRINDRAQNQVRQAMDLISAFAEKTGVATVVAMHFNKDSSQRAVDRTSGSAQYMAAVKSSWSVVHQKGDPANRRLLVPQKSNIAATEKSLPFLIHGFKYDSPRGTIETARIEYEAPVLVDVEDAISPQGQPAISMTARARSFLREQLQYGRKGARELHNAAEEQGIKKDTLWDAKQDLGIIDEREGYQGKSFWRMPDGRGEE